MLPLELLKVIFGALSRDNLDALMLANRTFRNIVLRDFDKEPFRYFEALDIYKKQSYAFDVYGKHSYTFVATTEDEHLCGDDEDFSRRMRHARVGRLAFLTVDRGTNFHFNEDIYELLLPLKDAWRDGHIITPSIASPSVFRRALSDLFQCKSMLFNTVVYARLSTPFTSLPAVRECTFLRILRPPGPLTGAGILDWLNVDARSKEPKRLEVVDYQLRDNVQNFVQHLKTDFIQSKTTRCYVVKITANESACERLLGRFVNKESSKVMVISSGFSGMRHFVAVEVKRTDET